LIKYSTVLSKKLYKEIKDEENKEEKHTSYTIRYTQEKKSIKREKNA